MSSSEKLIAKVVRVVLSCETREQLQRASLYVQAADRRLDAPCRIGFRATINGVFDVAQGRIDKEKIDEVTVPYLFRDVRTVPREITRQREKLMEARNALGHIPDEIVLTEYELDLIRYQEGFPSSRRGDAHVMLFGIPVVIKEKTYEDS